MSFLAGLRGKVVDSDRFRGLPLGPSGPPNGSQQLVPRQTGLVAVAKVVSKALLLRRLVALM